VLRRPRASTPPATPPPIGDALRDARFWIVTASFTACGFHVGFLGVHMPGVIERCGLPASLAGTWIAVAGGANALGSIAAGQMLRRQDAERLLAALYVARAVGIAALLAVTPTTSALLWFALLMGATHMATLPPTVALLARHYGAARLGGLLGLVMLLHQVGSFAGIWLGGVLAHRLRSDTVLWCIDIALALGAALLAMGQRERTAIEPTPRRTAAAQRI
jgi:predicted MFS family arabinose efflux permease